jgi:hypothetical protein
MSLKLKKLFGLVVLTLGLQTVFAQVVTLESDTVCVGQDVILKTTVDTASKYYWGTCSAWLERDPIGKVVASGNGMNGPTPIELVRDSAGWHLFVANFSTNFELTRHFFGQNLEVDPISYNLGNISNTMPGRTTGLSFIKVGDNHYGFAIGGIGTATTVTRLEFGTNLSNLPIATSLGNLSGLLVSPQDIHMFTEGGDFYAYYFNGLSGNLMRLNFGSSITGVPTVTDLGNPGGSLAFPTSLRVVEQNGSKHMFVVNRLNNSLTRLDFGLSLLNVPAVFNLGNAGGFLDNPRDIAFAYDDNLYYGYVTNEANNSIVMLKFGANITNVPTSVVESANFAAFNGPRGITNLVRQKDNVYGFVTNYQTNTISRIHYDSSTYATTLKATTAQPPIYAYTKAGVYNIYYEIVNKDGTTYSEQHRITAVDRPKLDFHNDTTICQGDTIFMVVNGVNLSKILWEPSYNLLYQNDTTSVFVHPEEDYTYNIFLEFSYGCKFDTMINVAVSKIKADAGPDRLVADGAVTELGGAYLSSGNDMAYNWYPLTYLNDSRLRNPISQPLDSVIYYTLQVENAFGCKKFDTVEVRTYCGDISVPNAFNPVATSPSARTFGIENYQLSKLDYFRVFNRYGQLMFETTDPRQRWNGVYENQPQPLGTYVWMASGICNNGRKVQRQGNVLLVR